MGVLDEAIECTVYRLVEALAALNVPGGVRGYATTDRPWRASGSRLPCSMRLTAQHRKTLVPIEGGSWGQITR